MKLYCYKALNSDSVDFFVMAESEMKARIHVKKKIDTDSSLQGKQSNGWPFKYKVVIIENEGEVFYS